MHVGMHGVSMDYAWIMHGACMGDAWRQEAVSPDSTGLGYHGRDKQPSLQGYLLYRRTLPELVKTTRVRGAASGPVSGEVEGWSPADRFQEVAAANFATAQDRR